eukprot:1052413-Pleurochrysis_carterae.AAC.1
MAAHRILQCRPLLPPPTEEQAGEADTRAAVGKMGLLAMSPAVAYRNSAGDMRRVLSRGSDKDFEELDVTSKHEGQPARLPCAGAVAASLAASRRALPAAPPRTRSRRAASAWDQILVSSSVITVGYSSCMHFVFVAMTHSCISD